MQNLFEGTFTRPDLRKPDQLRPIDFRVNFAGNATGSVLSCFGDTQVICAATIEKKVPNWMMQQGVKGGWVSAEYAMLPYSTLDRKQRDSSRGKPDGRSIEIQRLIGRSMRAVIDLQKMPGYTLWIDCDVLQADGGTRTAAISGAYVAAMIALKQLVKQNVLTEMPIIQSVSAVSVGVYLDQPVLDLNYDEDKDASVDFNVVMTGDDKFVEVQGAGEEATFSQEQLDQLLVLAKGGISQIREAQIQAIASAG